MGFIGLFKLYNEIDSGKNKSTVILGYGDMTLKETRGTQRMVAMVALATRGNNWRNLEKCHGWRAAVDMPRPSDVFIPHYFHC